MSIVNSNDHASSKFLQTLSTEAKSYRAFRRKFLRHRPGHLTTQGTLSIKTRLAQQHFLTLLTFAKRIKKIYRAAQQDDPYADAALIHIEQILEKAQAFLQKKLVFYQQKTPEPSTLLMPMMDTEQPLCVPVRFGIPYANMAARILAEFDTLFCCVISLYQWGLLIEQPLKSLLHELSEPLREVWKSTKHWQPTGLTRTTIKESIVQTSEEIPPLDPRVLSKEWRAKYAPPIIQLKSSHQITQNRKHL